MIADSFILMCLAFGLTAGSCVDFSAPQKCSPTFVPLSVEKAYFPNQRPFEAPIASDCNRLPFTNNNLAASGPVVASKIYAPILPYSESPNTPVLNDNLFSGSNFNAAFNAGRNYYPNVVSSGGYFNPETPTVQVPNVNFRSLEPTMIPFSNDPSSLYTTRCICTKTIVRPQIYQRIVTVPKIQRFLKRTVTPVIENIVFKTTPLKPSCGDSSVVYPDSSSTCP